MATETQGAEAPALAAPETEAPEAAAPQPELRAELIAKLKANRKAANDAKSEPVKPEVKPAKDKASKPAAEKPEAKDGEADADEGEADAPPEVKAARRQLAKAKRKLAAREAQLEARERQAQQFEATSQEQIKAFQKDPVAWLKANKVDIRKVLIEQANDDAEDPRDKKLREHEAELKRIKDAEEARETEATQAQQEAAVRQIRGELGTAWEKAEGDEYPTLAAMLEPEHIAERACEIMLEHYRETRKELAPTDIFAQMEKELAPLRTRLEKRKSATTKVEPPEQVRSGRKAAVNPEARESARPKEDVTRRITREQSIGRPLSLDRESLRERLVEKARGALR